MRAPEALPVPVPVDDAASAQPDVTRDERAFTVLVRNALFQLVRALSRKDWGAAAELIDGPPAVGDATVKPASEWPPGVLQTSLEPFFTEHLAIRTDPAARAPANTRITKTNGERWEVVQVLCDAADANDWALAGFVDIGRSRAEGRPVLQLTRIGT